MVEVVIYTRDWCPYSSRAKAVLDAKGVAYREVDIEADATKAREMAERTSGRDATPQIFIDGRFIGGHEELGALLDSGELDRLLGLPA